VAQNCYGSPVLTSTSASLRPASHRAYGVRVPLSSPWLPDSHAPRPPPAPPSRQSPPTPLTSLTESDPEVPSTSVWTSQHGSAHLFLITNHRTCLLSAITFNPYKNLVCTPLSARSYHNLPVVTYSP